jgi:hypothetical protein
MILNIAPVGSYDLPADVMTYASTLGGVVERDLAWPLKKFGRQGRVERILVIRAAP